MSWEEYFKIRYEEWLKSEDYFECDCEASFEEMCYQDYLDEYEEEK